MLSVLDLFAGLKGWSEPFAQRGHLTYTVEWERAFNPDLVADILQLTAGDLGGPGTWDVILASPPCTHFTVMQIGRHWNHDHTPKTAEAKHSLQLVMHTLELIIELQPKTWVMENPVAKLRRLLGTEVMHGQPGAGLAPWLDRRTVHYRAYGEQRMKPTDLWSDAWLPSLELKPQCRTRRSRQRPLSGQFVELEGKTYVTDEFGNPCHLAAKRGSYSGTQGMNSAESAKIPVALARDVCRAAERDL